MLISTVFITVPRLRCKQWCLDTPDLPLGSLLRQRVVTHFKVFMVGIGGCAFGFRYRKTPCHFIPRRNGIRLGWDRWKDAKEEVLTVLEERRQRRAIWIESIPAEERTKNDTLCLATQRFVYAI